MNKTSPVLELTSQNFESLVSGASLPIFLDFWASWCVPCRLAKPQVEKLAKNLEGRVIVAAVNVDTEPGLAEAFGVRGIPAFALLNGKRVIDSFTGFASAGMMEKRIFAKVGLQSRA